MRILNFGSVNIDHVYRVPHFVRPGETLSCSRYDRFAGGKGFNQSIALSRGGAEVHHAGRIGQDGEWLRHALAQEGVAIRHLQTMEGPTGHACIQVDDQGQNSIVLFPGANQAITPEDASGVLSDFGAGDLLLVQNEISSVAEILREAAERGLTIAFNPAPMRPGVLEYPLDLVDLFVLNEIEAAGLHGKPRPPERLLLELRDRYPKAHFLLTLGAKGVMALTDGDPVSVPARRVRAVDTTAAGDTFLGYFLATRTAGASLQDALRRATAAAAICISRPGASLSIPFPDEVETLISSSQGPL